MKIVFLKAHNGYGEKDVADVEEGLGNYLIAVGAADEKVKEKVQPAKEKEKVVVTAKIEKKSPSGPNSKKK